MVTGFPLSRKNLTDSDLYTYALVLNEGDIRIQRPSWALRPMQAYRYYVAHLGVSRRPQLPHRGLTADRLAGLAFSPKASALSIMSVSPSTRKTTPGSQISSLLACLRHRRRLGQAVREAQGNCQGVFSNRAMIGEPDAGWRVERLRERGLEVLSLSVCHCKEKPARGGSICCKTAICLC
jgi:hypothetical protein